MRACAGAVATALVLLGAGCGKRTHHITVRVGGSDETVAQGTTFREATDVLGLRPRSGSLLDVEGKVLRAHAFAGTMLVNGGHARGGRILQTGDRITLVDGRSRREGLLRRATPVSGGIFAQPQYELVRSPGTEVVVEGSVSHEVVSRRFERMPGSQHVERAVALTFDDGPSPEYTPGVLAVLRRLRVHATFFVIGFQVDADPELVRMEHRAGMAIGNHTYNHPEVPPFGTLPARLLDDEVALGAQSIERAGVRPQFLRPPAGSSSAAVVRAAQAVGERVVLWSVDPVDWQAGTTPAQIKRRVLEAVRPGSIVLLHDGGGDRSATIAALPGIVKGIRHRHLRLVTLSPR